MVDSKIVDAKLTANGKVKANISGGEFENAVRILKILGFIEMSYEEYKEGKRDGTLPPRYIVHNVPYRNLLNRFAAKHGSKRKRSVPKTEFIIHADNVKSTPEFPLNYKRFFEARVECKWQDVSGTTQFKLPYTVVDLHYGPPEKNIILLVGGKGYDKDLVGLCKVWCENKPTWKGAPKIKRKNIKLMNLDGFVKWANKAFVM